MAIKISITPAEPALRHWAAAAADVVAEVLRAKPAARIGLPTGESPLPVYAELRRRHSAGGLDSTGMRLVMLDEYLDPPRESLTSWSWLGRELLVPLGVTPERVLRLPWQGAGIEAACAEFERELARGGGCDLQLLGLGANGHIGFNEPGSPLDSRTRVVVLTPATAAVNRAYWNGAFEPERAVTQGLATILSARRILLLVRGGAKAAILRRALLGPSGGELPGACLRTAASLQVLADEAAAAALPQSADYNIEWL
ncbi:MAG: glucosamine-6-phosphate deaminase [Terriglobales bacterium]